MKKHNFEKFFRRALFLIGALSIIAFLPSCEDDEEPIPDDPIASFQFEVSEDNWQTVAFTNFSQNAETYSWDFGDGNSSTEENPTHDYDEAGEYTVILTATNSVGETDTFSEDVVIEDPFEALRRIAGDDQKTWKLWRGEGTTLGVGPDAEGARTWWSLSNDGTTPCRYYHEFTFHLDGTFEFDDNGVFFGDAVLFGGTELADSCFEATAENMTGPDGQDYSPLLSGTHEYEFDPNTNTVTLNGLGAWMGLPQLTTTEESNELVEQKSFQISVEEQEGYDLLYVSYSYEDLYWDFTYAHYYDESLEPDVVEEVQEVPDLESITPTELGHTFESDESFDLLGDLDGGVSIITTGVDDPADAEATKVGKLERTADQYQEAQLRVSPEPKNIQFDNFTKVSLDVYLPSDNDYDPLTRKLIIGFGDMHTTEEWWNALIQHESEELALDEWVTVTFELDNPSFSSNEGETVYDRENLDMIFIQIGGSAHTTAADFYIRNLVFE
ncbi:MAG: PKD domain-containing protein [Bacteroidales bacterium]